MISVIRFMTKLNCLRVLMNGTPFLPILRRMCFVLPPKIPIYILKITGHPIKIDLAVGDFELVKK